MGLDFKQLLLKEGCFFLGGVFLLLDALDLALILLDGFLYVQLYLLLEGLLSLRLLRLQSFHFSEDLLRLRLVFVALLGQFLHLLVNLVEVYLHVLLEAYILSDLFFEGLNHFFINHRHCLFFLGSARAFLGFVLGKCLLGQDLVR